MIHITVSEIASSLVLYTIIHSLIWFGRNVERFAANEVHHLIIRHKKSDHKGHYSTCNDCLTETSLSQLVSVEQL